MLDKAVIQKSIIWACEQEVLAPKPGNVNVYSDGHNMQVQDFITSAHAIASPLTVTNASVGERILRAIEATQQVVNCNTNLGIVLLFAPLCMAIEQCEDFSQLQQQLSLVLKNLSIDDAQKCYQAIRLAHAGGMGSVSEQDINDIPTVTLLQAMEAAKNRDTIAAQYLNNYQQIFETGRSNLTSAIISGESVEWATTFAYLYLLTETHDTLICRKQGQQAAKRVSIKAKSFTDKLSNNNKIATLATELEQWDKELKSEGINPGTTADMTASTLLLRSFEQAFIS